MSAAPQRPAVPHDLRLESRVRATARRRLASEGRLALLDDVVDAAMQRLTPR